MKVKERPDGILDAKVIKIKTGCGNMYITVSFLDGKPFEVFASLGKAGGCTQTIVSSLSMVISHALRADVDVNDIIAAIRHTRCPNSVSKVEGKGDSCLSCVDGIAIAMEKVIGENNFVSQEDFCPECLKEECSTCIFSIPKNDEHAACCNAPNPNPKVPLPIPKYPCQYKVKKDG